MSRRNSSFTTKAIILFDGLIAGWDFRTALVHYMNGEPYWTALMFALGVGILALAFGLLVVTDI